MKIALCWNRPEVLATVSIRHEHYIRGFQRLGHEVITVCLAEAAVGFRNEVIPFVRPDDCRQPEFWKRLAPDVVMMVTWLSSFKEFAAARRAGIRTIALADSDGQVGLTTHWRHTLYRSITQHTRLIDRVASAKFFLQRMLMRQDEVATVIRSLEESDVVYVNTKVAVANVCRFLRAANRVDLADRVKVCPYPVDAVFSDWVDSGERANRFIAVGRWDSPQKDGKLLAASLDRYYERGGTAETVIFGNGCDVFAEVSNRWNQVRPCGVESPETVAKAMSSARSLLLTSRWESGPIVAFEALSQGCTLISTDIPNLRELVESGLYGQISERREPDAFADGMFREGVAWDASHRNPREIAKHWMRTFEIGSVCRTLLASVDSSDGQRLPAWHRAPTAFGMSL